MTGLVAFLNARLDEDEATAKACIEAKREPWQEWEWEDQAPADIAHYGRHGPARVLREVDAKRKILAGHQIHSEPETRTMQHIDRRWNTGTVEHQETGRLSWWCGTCDQDRDYGHIGGPEEGCPTIRALAAVYSDHPDYLEEWRP
jgi:hypothetical protein